MSSDSGLSQNIYPSFSGLPRPAQDPRLQSISVLPDAAYTFTPGDSGRIFQLSTITAARTYTLPAVASSAGMNLKVIVSVAPAGNVATFQAPANTMSGSVVVSQAAGVLEWAGALVASRSVVTAANTSVGSTLSLFCDGILWHAIAESGKSADAAAIWAFA